MIPDAFGTAAVRAAVLGAWRASPARLREDANTEEDHARGYYRDRVVVELAQNAADAATRAEVPGRLLLRLDRSDDGTLVLVAANTGDPLEADGVVSLSSMRASSKRGDRPTSAQVVGRFGVGFAAVRAVSDEISLLSTTGGVRFSARDTAGLLAESSADNPGLADEVRRRDGSLPALRLPFPAAGSPPAGYDTAVVLELRDEVAADEVRGLLRDVGDPLLLGLPGLVEILVEDNTSDTPNRRIADVQDRWTVLSAEGELRLDLLADRPVEERSARTWRVTWAVPRGQAEWARVVHAPTPTDEPCTVPALLVATLPLDPTRRHVAGGPLTDAVLDHAADTYARLAHEHAMAGDSGAALALVPMGLPAGALDGALRERIVDRLSRTPLLLSAAVADADKRGPVSGTAPSRAADRGTADRPLPTPSRAADRHGTAHRPLVAPSPAAEGRGTADRALLAPSRAVMLAGPAGHEVRAVAALGRRIGGLVVVPAGREAQARVLGVEARGLADVVEEIRGIEDGGWADLYDALSPLADDARDREALGALPVLLADGRVVRGARGLVVLDAAVADAVGPDALRDLGRWGLRVVDPQAAHPLLARLGADAPDARGLLQHPALRAAVLEQADDDDLQLADEVTDAVLAVVRAVVGDADPRDAAEAVGGAAAWLGLVTLPAADGEPTPAHGLVLPGGPAAALLDPRVVAPVTLDAVERWGPTTLVAAGVRDDLALVRVTDVVAEPAVLDPDGTDDASLAAQSLDGWPEYVELLSATLGAGEYVGDAVAVADLDAVDPDRWHELLSRLAGEPELRRALLEPVRGERGATAPSYTAWWLRERGPAGLGGIFAVDDDSDQRAGGEDVDEHDDDGQVTSTPDGITPSRTRRSDDAAGSTLRDVLPGAPDVLRGLDTAVQVALGGVAGLDDLRPEAWPALLDALGPAGTPIDSATAVALWRGLSATAVRLPESGGADPLTDGPERVPAIVAPGRVAMVHADDAAVADQPMWWQRTDVAAMVPSTSSRAEALARLLDIPTVAELAAGQVDRAQDGVVTAVPAGVAAVVPGAPVTWVEHDELTVDGAPVDWWVTGVGPTALVRTVHVAGLAAGLAQAAGRWWARSAVEAVLVTPERADELALDAALED
ncbi:sacsin N-terminal ATP-binding-like domain-containing protein [Cellulomonas sp. URHD0024]|uniref:sacsin N-terminal ATP-binding-like domain-containing protein n=1 Tax=Cellulomonas sp. URHD0024 TaxID=1302620 RepID=UPI0003FD26B0|nr:ATP-binding protein [Cellulomonas sp. URHD0024]